MPDLPEDDVESLVSGTQCSVCYPVGQVSEDMRLLYQLSNHHL
jgi:hypothetical protein